MNKVIRILALGMAAVVLLTGCSQSEAASDVQAEAAPVVIDTATREIQQNDFRGGVMRTLALQTTVLGIMENMKRNNIVVREDNPNSYWTTDGYQDFVSTFLATPIINDVQWFNEEETDWNTVVTQIYSVPNSFTQLNSEGQYTSKYSQMYVQRNEKDDYTIGGLTGYIGSDSGYMNYRILYDCDKDWCKAYSTVDLNGSGLSDVTSELFEYARLNNNVFAIQTATERLLIVLEDAAEDTDIRVRSVKEFYYSRLSGGQRTTYKPYEPLPESDDDCYAIRENIALNKLRAKYPLLNEYGEVATQYGVQSSLFLREDVRELGYPWVFEDGALQQAIIFKNNTLVVTTFNKLTERYERFIYSTEKVKPDFIAEAEAMVNIEGLVGFVDVKTSEIGPESEESAPKPAADSSPATSDSAPTAVEEATIPTEESSSENIGGTQE